MGHRAVRWSVLAMVLACLSANAAVAQTIELGGTGEGGSGKSIGGNIPAAPAQADEEKPPAEPWYTIHAQATVILQGYGPFRSPYMGQNSFVSAHELRTTATVVRLEDAAQRMPAQIKPIGSGFFPGANSEKSFYQFRRLPGRIRHNRPRDVFRNIARLRRAHLTASYYGLAFGLCPGYR